MQILRPRETADRLGISLAMFWADYVKSGRLRSVKLGKRAVGFVEDEVDQLITEMARLRDRQERKETV